MKPGYIVLIKHERENPGFQSGDESEFLVPPYVFVV